MYKADSVKGNQIFNTKKRDSKYTSIGNSCHDYQEEQICKKGSFSQRLKFIREFHGDSQADLAYYLMVTRQTIGSYETGRTEPCLETLRQLSSYYNISVDCLICNCRCSDIDATKLSS